MDAKFISSIHHCPAAQWDRLCGSDYPFLRHAFFAALEDSGSTCRKTGWQAHHLIIEEQGEIIFVMPLFIKYHSYGEYVFDWSWAEAYHRYGLDYYPKLLNAIPFTPATGPRWGLDKRYQADAVLPIAFAAIEEEAIKQQYSSSHFLFTAENTACLFEKKQYARRIACQYHWFNQDYKNFDDFLSHFTSRKRKNVKKERACVREQSITVTMKEGHDITEEDWQAFFLFYHLTYFKRSGREGYLTQDFFPLISHSMKEHIVMAQASKNNTLIAAALYFKDSDTLYGRYWGCKEEQDHLHFETCYYQGIDYAIKQGLKKFDPGAQGEHKIQRGFSPTRTYSYHWLEDDELFQAVKRFVRMEAKDIEEYIVTARQRLPFKNPNQ